MHVALVTAKEEFILQTATGQKVMSFTTKEAAFDWNEMRAIHAELTCKTIAKLTLVKVTTLYEVI